MGELITFETAKIAKEKGFTGIRSTIYSEKPIERNQDLFEIGVHWHIPTQSVLSRWLREKHGIDVEPHLVLLRHNHIEKGQTEDRTYHCLLRVKGLTHVLHDLTDKSHTQAYEYGLQEALKLI